VRQTLIVEPEGLAGHENMRRDCLLLRAAQEEVLFFRLYRWNPGCLSFGRNEPAKRRYDVDRIKELGLDTVRRPTGGRAIWHHHEVTYSVAGPTAMFGSLGETYIFIHETLARALGRLGVDAKLAEKAGRTPGLGSGACFNSPVGGEILVGGKKLIGSAQLREGNVFLQHGSILLKDEQEFVENISNFAAKRTLSTSLEEIVGGNVDFATVASAIEDELMESWPGDWERDVVPENNVVANLDFTDPEWTWRR
jgi:lipoate-protein ligase A